MRTSIVVVGLSLLASACTIDDLDLSNRACPCIEGWVCDTVREICVEIDPSDAGPSDAGDDSDMPTDSGGDTAVVDSGVPDVFDAGPCIPTTEVCNGVDDDCDEGTDEDFGVGDSCSVGVGECRRSGEQICDGPDAVVCDASPGAVATEVCNTLDDDCDGTVDETGCTSTTVYTSCAAALAAGETSDGVYLLRPVDDPVVAVRCDMSTDGGGWTLVASTQTTPLNDEASAYYSDLSTLAPASGHTGIWSGLRDLAPEFDVRFACRATVSPAAAPFTVDLSYYDVIWYGEWTTGTDAESCFSEGNGAGADPQPPARQDNIAGTTLPLGDPYNHEDMYLEGEDGCDDMGDFTVDFDDRGMDANENDGTDWGEDDGEAKCGTAGLSEGQWFIFVRET